MPIGSQKSLFLYAGIGPDLNAYRVDVEAGTLEPGASCAVAANVQYAWPHHSGRVMFVASSDSASGLGPAGNTHHLTALRIDAASGALSQLGPAFPLPTRPIHLCADAPSRHVLVAVNNPAGLRVYRVSEDGTLSGEVTQPEPIDPGIFPHQIRVTSDNSRAILVARGHDATAAKPEEPGSLKLFHYDDGRLSNEISIAPNGGYGFGPRHLDFHPDRPWVYVSLERQNRLDMFELSNGGLVPRFCSPLLSKPNNIRSRQIAGTVHVHPRGSHVYAVNRAEADGENSFAVFRIDPSTGEPILIQHIETHGIHCRTFHIDPSGKLLVGAHIKAVVRNENGANRVVPAGMAVFRIGEDGRLTFIRRYDVDTGGRLLFWMGMVAV